MINLGKVKPGSTLTIPFSSFDKDDGSSITMTNYAVADVLVYKDGSTTERASTSGFTATTDFDSKTGKHVCIITLSDNTTAGFFAAGSEYLVGIDAVTVDTVTTGGWIARFSIGYEGAVLDTTIATLSTQTSFTLTTGPAEDDALNDMWCIIHDVASAVQWGKAIISDYTGSTKTVTLAAGTTFTAAASDNISIMGPAPLQATTAARKLTVESDGMAHADCKEWLGGTIVAPDVTGVPTVDAVYIDGSATGAAGTSLLGVHYNNRGHANTELNTLDTTINTVNTQTSLVLNAGSSDNDEYNGSLAVIRNTGSGDITACRIDDYVGSTKTIILSDTPKFTVQANDIVDILAVPSQIETLLTRIVGTIASGTHNPQSGDAYAYLGTNLGSLGANATEAGGTGDHLTAVPWNASWDAQVESEVNDALVVLKLDHLVAVADADDVVDNSVIAKMVSKSATADWSGFVNTTDSLEALRDRGDAAWITATGFSTHSATDVWAAGTRTLTAGTNIDGSTFTSIPWNASWDAEVQSEVNDGLVAFFTSSAQLVDNIWDEATSGHVASGSFGQAMNTVRAGTAQAGASTTITLDGSASATDDFYNNTIIFLTGGTGAGQSRIISDYVGSTKVATVSAWTTNPSSDTIFVILPFGAIPGASAPTASEVADAVWDEAQSGHTTAGTFGRYLDAQVANVETDTQDIQSRIPAALVSGRMDSNVQAMANNVITAAVIATDAIDADALASDAVAEINASSLSPLASGTAQGATASTIQLAASHSFANDILNGNIIKILTGTGAGQTRLIVDYTGATDTADIVPDWTTNPSTDSTYEIVEGSVNIVALDYHRGASINQKSFFNGTGYAGTGNVIPNVTTVATVSSVAFGGIAATSLSSGAIDAIRDGIVDDATRIDASALNTASTTIGSTGAGLTAVPWNASWDAEVQSEVNDALVVLKLDHLIAVADADDVADNSVIAKMVSKSVTADWSSFVNTTDALEALRDRGDAAWITATGFSTLDAAGVRTAIGLSSANLDTQLSTIVADTNELQTDWANGGRLDLIVDAILDDTGTSGVVVAAGSKTGYSLSTTGLNSVVLDSGILAQIEGECEDALQITIPDSIPADGTRPSVQQGIYMINQLLTEGGISGTTWTVKKVDGTTTLFTLTLDSSTAPTTKTRAT